MFKAKNFFVMAVFSLTLCLCWAGDVLAQAVYDYDVIAQTGVAIIDPDPIGGGNTGPLVDLGRGPSLNNLGKVAFIARDQAGSFGRVIVDNNGVIERNFPITSLQIVGNDVQVNDSSQVTWQDQVTTNNDTFIRRLDSNSGGVSIGIGSNFFTTPFSLVVGGSTINQSGRVAFTGDLKTGGTVLANRADGSSSHNMTSAVDGFPTFYAMIADNNRTIIRQEATPGGGAINASLILLSDETFSAGTVIAGPPDFSAIAAKPGLSDDGNIVSFLGAGAQGTGIFARAAAGAAPFKVVGISGDGRLDPGETFVDTNGNGQFDAGETDTGYFSSFSSLQRVGVNQTAVGQSGLYTIAYVAMGSGNLGTTNQIGLYTSNVDISQPDSPIVTPPSLVVEVGGTIPGVTGTVQEIGMYDPINNRGEVVFWVKTTTSAQAVVRANTGVNEIDRWWATVNDAPLNVTWKLGVNKPTGLDNYTLKITLDRDIDIATTWSIADGTGVSIRSAATGALIRNVNLTQVPLSTALIVDAGQLSPGIYTFTINGIRVPVRPIVQRVTFQLLNRDSSGALTAYRDLEALFAADHQAGFAPVNVKIPEDAVIYPVNSMEELVDRFAPILLFDDGSAPGAIGGPERYTQAYDAGVIFNNTALFSGHVTGANDQQMDLSVFETTPAFTTDAAIYGNVLRKSDLIARGMLPADGLPDELAVNYWFHYPRSNWRFHGGFNDHEGDWEGVTVFLRWNQTGGYFEPRRVAVSQHEKALWGSDIWNVRTDGGENILWSTIENNGGFRPNVYVGLGGHASYSNSGKTAYLTPILFKDEFHYGNLSPFIATLDQSIGLFSIGDINASEWLRFPGHWGRLNIGGNPFGLGADAPQGPAFLAGGFDYGARWLNPWSWARGFSEAEHPATAAAQGNAAVTGNTAALTADGTDAVLTWSGVTLSSLAAGVQFNYHFTSPGDGDVLDVLVNGTSVGTLVGTANANADFELSPMFDISGFAGQTVELALRLRSVNALSAQVLLNDISIVNPDFADLIIDAAAYTPATYVRGQTLPVDVTVRNQGTFEVPSSQSYSMTVYLSTDNIFDSLDRVVHAQTTDLMLPAAAAMVHNLAVTVPGDMPLGDYFVIVQADSNGEILELDENNNLFISAGANVRVAVDASAPVPAVALTADPSAIEAGESSTLNWMVTDAVSCTASGGWAGVKNSASGSETVSPAISADYFLDCAGPGGDASGNTTVTVGSNNPPVLNLIGDKTATEGQWLAFSVTATDPDGDVLTMTAQLSNGNPLSTIGATFTDNGNGTGAFSWTPGFTQSGIYTLVFQAGDGLDVDEETITVTVNDVPVPDFLLTALSTTTTAIAPGNPMSAANTVKNQGTVAAGAFVNAFHLSTDAVYGNADDIVFTTTRSVASLAAGASSAATTGSLTVPAATPLGDYFLCAKADDTAAVAEQDENNNIRCTAATIKVASADLVMTAVSGPAAGVTGGVMSVNDTTKNQGAGVVTASFGIGYYLSTDALITTADRRIGTRSVSSLAGGASKSGTRTVTIPSNLAPGNYYLGAIADYNNLRPESDETNNALAGNVIAVTPGADLVMTAVSGPAAATRGTAFTANNTAANQGTGAAASFNVGIYLSADPVITTSDRRLASRSVGSLAVGASSSAATAVTIPTTVAAGTYYLGAIADYANTRPEANETNNALAGNAVTVQ